MTSSFNNPFFQMNRACERAQGLHCHLLAVQCSKLQSETGKAAKWKLPRLIPKCRAELENLPWLQYRSHTSLPPTPAHIRFILMFALCRLQVTLNLTCFDPLTLPLYHCYGYSNFTPISSYPASTSAPTHIKQRNTWIMIRHHIIIRRPRVGMDVLKPRRLLVRQGRADIHVVEGLGVHVVGTVLYQQPPSHPDSLRGVHLLGIPLLNRMLQRLIQLHHPRHSRKVLQRLHKGKLVEITRGNDVCRWVKSQNLRDECLFSVSILPGFISPDSNLDSPPSH